MNLKGVVVYDKTWLTNDEQSPYFIMDTQERHRLKILVELRQVFVFCYGVHLFIYS